MDMTSLFQNKKPIIGMVHCLALPGTSHYNGEIQSIYDLAIQDTKSLEKGGVDAIMIENMGDDPFGIKLELEQRMALCAAALQVRMNTKLPLGIDAAMNDYEAALSIAFAIGANFVRIPVFVDTVEFYGGIIKPVAMEVMRYRKKLNAEHIQIWADIHVKHSNMLLPYVTIQESASVAESVGADALIVTGSRIGEQTPLQIIEDAKKSVKIPVIAGSGVNSNTINQQLEVADGAIVGSSFKENGILRNPIKVDLVNEMVNARKSQIK